MPRLTHHDDDDFDECPDAADLERFGDDTIKCLACGADVWHDVPLCHECGEAIEDYETCRPRRHYRRDADAQRRGNNIIVIMVILGLLLGGSLFGIFRLM